jgi:hypothetical protein
MHPSPHQIRKLLLTTKNGGPYFIFVGVTAGVDFGTIN